MSIPAGGFLPVHTLFVMMHAKRVPAGVTWLMSSLVNAVWQLPIVLAAGAAAARFARRLGPAWAHRVWVAALVAAAVLPACSVANRALPWSAPGAASPGGSVHTSMGPAVAAGGPVLLFAGWLVWALLGCWLGWMLVASCQLGMGLVTVRRMRASSSPLSAMERAQLPADWPAVATGTVAGLHGPVVVGVVRPALLLPPGFLARACGDARFALAHERAHITRRDYAKNLALTLVSLPLSWHPCMWLLRTRVLESREVVCDAMAAAAAHGGRESARALLRLAALYPQAVRTASWPAAGMFDGRSLERRITTMMHEQKQLHGLARAAALGALTLFAAGAGVATASARMDVSSAPSANPVAVHVSAEVMEGNIESRPAPVYPPEAKAAHQQGTVTLAAVITKQGTIGRLKVVHSAGKLLDQSALDAVRQWRYKPYLLNGDPVVVETTIHVTYSLAK